MTDALMKQLKKLRPAKPKRSSENARNNWKKLQNVSIIQIPRLVQAYMHVIINCL